MEVGWQTTRVLPGSFLLSAEASERIFGTLPPVHGLIEQSGAGSGQYEARSTWANAGTATTSVAASAAKNGRSRRRSIVMERAGSTRSDAVFELEYPSN